MAGSSPAYGGLADDSRMLQSEVSRLEDLLAATRAERDEVGSKYMAVSERVSVSDDLKSCKVKCSFLLSLFFFRVMTDCSSSNSIIAIV